ncbi:MAG TPA: leucyl aminopeptidase [Gaiellaceae bacterium]|nr:leucyl aminopeptidase [Gaiellaceae bacterium]
MEIAVSPDQPGDATPAVLVTDPPRDQLAELVSSGEVTTKRGTARSTRIDGARAIAVGAGPVGEIDADVLRDAAAAVVAAARETTGGTLSWELDERLPVPVDEQAQAIVEGAVLGAYEPGAWKTEPDDGADVSRLVLVTGADVAADARRAERVAHWANRARDLVNRPANDLTPATFADYAASLAEGTEGLSAEALGPDDMRELGMGALLAVGAGSYNEPRVIVMRWEPPQATRDDVLLGLVGKGMTFDSGGISLKPANHMEDMKGDMAGAAAVVTGIGAIAELGVPVRAIAVVAAAENMPSGRSMRPGDILTAANGKTIEVTNTDAEGRLVLADALWYAREQRATHVIDFATLTGAMSLALGDQYAGVFANDEAWLQEVVAAGDESGDYVWPFPLHPRYRRLIDSAFADMKNSSLRRLGAPVYATSFLAEFAGEGPWAHVDIAGPGFLTWSRGDYLSQVGGTGFGVRLIATLAQRMAAA